MRVPPSLVEIIYLFYSDDRVLATTSEVLQLLDPCRHTAKSGALPDDAVDAILQWLA